MGSARENISVEEIFERLAQRMDSYEDRPQQLQLARSIGRVFTESKTGIFEAGTGTGKSLSALIPAALSDKRVVISTNTIALQEQYLGKDIPLLKEILPFDIEAALLKGRGNYLGLRRWEEQLLEQELDDRLIDWVHTTESGDISELDFVPPLETWLEVNSDSDDCLRQKCPQFNNCFYFAARQRVESADIIVVNHALLLADAVSLGGILPQYQLLIVDEAHHLSEVATDAFSTAISNRGVRALCTRASRKVGAPNGMTYDIEVETHEFFNLLRQQVRGQKTRLREPIEEANNLKAALNALKTWLEKQSFDNLLDVELAQERAKLKAKALISHVSGYIKCLELVAEPSPDWVVWVEQSDPSGQRMKVVAAPLDVAPFIQDLLLDKAGLEASVWMSATLATGGEDQFSYFKRLVGISGRVIQEQVKSPFDYAKQAVLYLPRNMPDPNQPSFVHTAAQEIDRILSISEGRAFVLFTSWSALQFVFDKLSAELAYPCKRQGEMPRSRLIEWFKETPQAVLFGTASFWEGVSIDGEALSCVIIDRIPFQVPDDPVHEARCDVLKKDPQASWFNDLSLPHATMRLKQGVGRLIRTHKDTGMVAILDGRLTGKYYGKRILECLPPMTVVRTLDGFVTLTERFGAPSPSVPI